MHLRLLLIWALFLTAGCTTYNYPAPRPPSSTNANVTTTVFIPTPTTATSPADGITTLIFRPQAIRGQSAPLTQPQALMLLPQTCLTVANGSTCTIVLPAIYGMNLWEIDGYTNTSTTGTPIEITYLAKTVLRNTSNNATLTFNPIVANIQFAPKSSSCNITEDCSKTLSLQILDATGAQIIGNTPLRNALNLPVTISLVASNTSTLTTYTNVTQSPIIHTANENRLSGIAYFAQQATPVSIAATDNGGHFDTYTLNVAAASRLTGTKTIYITSSPNDIISLTDPQNTTALAETDNCAGIAVVQTPSTAGPIISIPVVTIGSGHCDALFTDVRGQQISVQIMALGFALSIQGHRR